MEALLITARFFHFSAVIMLAGVFAFERLVCGPAFRQSGATVASAAGLHRRLGWLAWASLALAIGSGAAWLVAVAAGMSGKPLGLALSQGAVRIVLTRTQFGEDWQLRFALAVALGFCLLVHGGRRWRTSEVIGWTALLLAAAMLASLAWAGHGASTPGLAGKLHLAADFCHLLAVGLWLGTLPPLIMLLTEAARSRDANWKAVVAQPSGQGHDGGSSRGNGRDFALLPMPRQQLVQLGGRMIGNTAQHVSEPSLGVGRH